MRVLVACEHTGTACDAFIARGHHAISCDLIPSEGMNPCPHHLSTTTYGECKLGCNQCGQGFAILEREHEVQNRD